MNQAEVGVSTAFALCREEYVVVPFRRMLCQATFENLRFSPKRQTTKSATLDTEQSQVKGAMLPSSKQTPAQLCCTVFFIVTAEHPVRLAAGMNTQGHTCVGWRFSTKKFAPMPRLILRRGFTGEGLAAEIRTR